MKGRKGKLAIAVAALATLVAVSVPVTALAKDVNRDRIPDRWEKRYGLSLKVDQRKFDQDLDGLRNRVEWLNKMSPRDRDTDDDGTVDGQEVEDGIGPVHRPPLPYPTEDVGAISAWDPTTEKLEVTLTAGGTVSGDVNHFTKIRCPLPEGTEPPSDPVDPADSDDSRVRPPMGAPGRPAAPAPDDQGTGGSEGSNSGGRPGSGSHPGLGPSLRCTIDDLAVGVPVRAIDVRYSTEGTVFTKVLLGEKPAGDPVTG
ncbi:MAG: hypothetical protein ACKOGM_07550 [Solirubrobacterales bacterium]